MILLDTDHFSIFMDRRDPRSKPLKERLDATQENVSCSIVSVEELLRGWLAFIHRISDVHRQLAAYDRLSHFMDELGDWSIIGFDEAAADEFVRLRGRKLRIGTMDLKIASIAIVNDALLITANLRDFAQVPDLRCENWLD